MQLGRPGAAVLRTLPIDMSRSLGRQRRLREPAGLPPDLLQARLSFAARRR